MALREPVRESSADVGDQFNPTSLVSRKPSALPAIYEYVVDAGRSTPIEIQEAVGVSKSVTHRNLQTLCDVGLVEKFERGRYRPSTISLDSTVISALGELRSTKQFDICSLAARTTSLDVPTVGDQLEMSYSNVRNAVHRLDESGFLEVRREPFENGRKLYRITAKGERTLRKLDVGRYLGWDYQESVAHENGLEGTPFRTPYEVEDAHYLSEEADGWLHPKRVASALGRNTKKTQLRFSKMAERGLLEQRVERRKLSFEATDHTRQLFDELDLFRISKGHELDLYSVATSGSLSSPFTTDELYAALVRRGAEVSTGELNAARDAFKRRGLLEGNPVSGYSFTIG